MFRKGDSAAALHIDREVQLPGFLPVFRQRVQSPVRLHQPAYRARRTPATEMLSQCAPPRERAIATSSRSAPDKSWPLKTASISRSETLPESPSLHNRKPSLSERSPHRVSMLGDSNAAPRHADMPPLG